MMKSLNDFGKLIVFLAIVTSLTTLAALSKIDAEVAVGVFLALAGYTAGNGVNAIRKQPGSPMLTAHRSTPALIVDEGPTSTRIVTPHVSAPVPEPTPALTPAQEAQRARDEAYVASLVASPPPGWDLDRDGVWHG